MERFWPALPLAAAVVFCAAPGYAAPNALDMATGPTVATVAYNGDPYSGRSHGGGRRHASKKTPEVPADTSKGETSDQHKAYLKKYGF